jgi:hypothetical protein
MKNWRVKRGKRNRRRIVGTVPPATVDVLGQSDAQRTESRSNRNHSAELIPMQAEKQEMKVTTGLGRVPVEPRGTEVRLE